jgi:hypothetical protein
VNACVGATQAMCSATPPPYPVQTSTSEPLEPWETEGWEPW